LAGSNIQKKGKRRRVGRGEEEKNKKNMGKTRIGIASSIYSMDSRVAGIGVEEQGIIWGKITPFGYAAS
jgi:hypothetical protein